MDAVKGTGSVTSDTVALLSQSTPPASVDRRTPTNKAADARPNGGDRPAVVVDLSDSSKALLERTKVAQAVADKLDERIDALKGKGAHAQPLKPVNGETPEPFSASPRASLSQATETTWEAGSKWGDPTLSDAEFLERAKDFLLSNAADQGWAPEKLQAFRDAVARGTLKFQKASEVPDLNYHTTTTYSEGGMANWTTRDPVGAVRKALENGDALAFWSADRGNVYVTW